MRCHECGCASSATGRRGLQKSVSGLGSGLASRCGFGLGLGLRSRSWCRAVPRARVPRGRLSLRHLLRPATSAVGLRLTRGTRARREREREAMRLLGELAQARNDGVDLERANATWSTSSFTSYHGQLLSLAVQWGVAIEIERAIKKSARFC